MSRPDESVREVYEALGDEIVAPFELVRAMRFFPWGDMLWSVRLVGGGVCSVYVRCGVVSVRCWKKGGGVFLWECGIEDPGVIRKARGVLKGIGVKRLKRL